MKLFIFKMVAWFKMSKEAKESHKQVKVLLNLVEASICEGLVVDKTLSKMNAYSLIAAALEGLAITASLKQQGMSLDQIEEYLKSMVEKQTKPLTQNSDGKVANVINFPKKNDTNH